MAVLSHQLDNTFHEPFINILEAKINNLKTNNDINKDIKDSDTNLPESEDDSIENNH